MREQSTHLDPRQEHGHDREIGDGIGNVGISTHAVAIFDHSHDFTQQVHFLRVAKLRGRRGEHQCAAPSGLNVHIDANIAACAMAEALLQVGRNAGIGLNVWADDEGLVAASFVARGCEQKSVGIVLHYECRGHLQKKR